MGLLNADKESDEPLTREDLEKAEALYELFEWEKETKRQTKTNVGTPYEPLEIDNEEFEKTNPRNIISSHTPYEPSELDSEEEKEEKIENKSTPTESIMIGPTLPQNRDFLLKTKVRGRGSIGSNRLDQYFQSIESEETGKEEEMQLNLKKHKKEKKKKKEKKSKKEKKKKRFTDLNRDN